MTRRALLLVLWLACVLVAVISLTWMLLAALVNSPRAWTLAIAHDQLGNATTGGSPDEMLSSRAWRAAQAGRRWGRVLARVLDAIEPGHCRDAYETELRRQQLPAEFQQEGAV